MKNFNILPFLFVLLSLGCAETSAQSYFKEGTVWKTVFSSTEMPPVSSIETNYLEGSEMVDGYETLKMYQYNNEDKQNTKLMGYIRTDGDKVYFKNTDAESGVWYLMYDFGLKVGEGCYVYSTDNNPYIGKPEAVYIKCVGISREADSNLTSLLIEEYEDETCSHFYTDAKWIKGLSADWGVMYNNYFRTMGCAPELLEATYNGETIYKKKTSDIEKTNSNIPKITIEGSTLTITNSTKFQAIDIYTSTGCHIGSSEVGVGETKFSLPHNGVYIIKFNDVTRTIVVQ